LLRIDLEKRAVVIKSEQDEALKRRYPKRGILYSLDK